MEEWGGGRCTITQYRRGSTRSYYSADTPFVSYFPSDPLPLPPSAHFEAVVGLGGDRIYSE